MDILKEAYMAANKKYISMCGLCNRNSLKKCKRKYYCLPLEIIIRLLDEKESSAEGLKALEENLK